jgi:hypothetical protein
MLTLLLVMFSTLAHAHDCDFLLRDGGMKSILRQTAELNAEIVAPERATPAEIYLMLKRESERVARAEVGEDLARRLRESQAHHYRVRELDPHQLTIFYRNALYALEQRAAQLWRRQEARSLAGRPLKPDLQNFAEHMLDTFFSPNGLNDRAMTSREAEEYFRAKPWMDFNWQAAIRAVEDAFKAGTEPVFDDTIFDWNTQSRIRIALLQDKRPGACCLSEPGCTLCPHNRGHLIKR